MAKRFHTLSTLQRILPEATESLELEADKPSQSRAWREVDLPTEFAPVISLQLSPDYPEDGIEKLTSGAPLELDDVEALMRDEGTQLPYLLTGPRR